MLRQTPSQTIGPFFAYGLTPQEYGKPGIAGNVLIGAQTQGERIRIQGRVLDGAGDAIGDALIEIWQANAHGRYRHPADERDEVALDEHFKGFGRAATDDNGLFWFETVKPGPVPGRGNSLQAPHVNVVVFSRGMLLHTFTRLYFSDETAANRNDPVLSSVDEARRGTLIAPRDETPGGLVYRFDIHLQGEQETVFFDV